MRLTCGLVRGTELMLNVLVALAMRAPAEPIIPAFFTGLTLHEICRDHDPGHCSMYVAGILDGIFYADTSKADVKLCPARLTNAEAAAIIVTRLREEPDLLRRAAAIVVRTALAKRFACRTEDT